MEVSGDFDGKPSLYQGRGLLALIEKTVEWAPEKIMNAVENREKFGP